MMNQYEKFTREQLAITKTKVRKWLEWNPEGEYEAFIETRMVIIPKPIDAWSFLVCLHEIGHVSTGDRLTNYLREYNAERWAIRRAKEMYNIVCPEYEEDAQSYIRDCLVQDLVFCRVLPNKIKPYVLDWIGGLDSISYTNYEPYVSKIEC